MPSSPPSSQSTRSVRTILTLGEAVSPSSEKRMAHITRSISETRRRSVRRCIAESTLIHQIDISPQWLEDKSTKWGAAAIAVPGEIRGLAAIHHRFGSLPWADLFEPSIILAREGIPMYEDLYGVSTSWRRDASDTHRG